MNLQNIKQILIDQKQDLESALKNKKIINRDDLKEYENFLKSSLIKVITGPRRAGKSVLCFQLLKDKNFGYVNFDDEQLSTIKTEDLNLLLQTVHEINHGKKLEFLFFDEIQNAPNWELFANRLKRQGFNLIITGSNAKLLSQELSTHLTGRHYSLKLYPFSFQEYLKFHDFDYSKKIFTTQEKAEIKKLLDKYLSCGGFPEVAQGEDYQQYLRSLYSDILTKDIILKHKPKYTNTFKDFSLYLISNFARKITFNRLKKIFDLKSAHTSQKYFSFIQESYLIFPIEKFSYKTKESLASPRKIYVIDTGLINALSQRFSRDIGHIYENAVAIELLRNQKIKTYYWEDSVKKHELDFVIKQELKIKQLIQVCWDISDFETKKRELRSLLKASKELKCSNLLVITEDYDGEEEIKSKKVKFVPLWKWLLN